MKKRPALSSPSTARISWAAMWSSMKPSHVKVVVLVVAATPVEGAGVRAEGEAVNGVGVGGEVATKPNECFCGGFRRLFLSPTSLPSPAAIAGQFPWYGSGLGATASGIENPFD